MWGTSLSRAIPAGVALLLAGGCIPADSQPQRTPPPAPTRTAVPRLPTNLLGLIESEPVWTAQQVPANARVVSAGSYVVQPGDTLRGIGNRTGVGSEMLAKVNHLAPPYGVKAGQVLSVPGGRYHAVAAGETGIAIAAAYGVKWSDIVALNDLAEPYLLRSGRRLLLPAGARMPGTTPAHQPSRPPSPRPGRAAFLDIDIDDVVTGSQPAVDPDARIAAPVKVARPLSTAMPIAEPGSFSGRFNWPIDGALLSRFGPGVSGVVNEGIDIRATKGTPIKAAADGVVAYAGDEIGVYGGLILIVHGSGWVTAYGHADRVDVVRGQKITRGQVIGLSGDSGRHVDQPKLHFEIRRNRQPVNPLQYLPAKG
ncbi:MAG: M23 family metallopeptidase [Sphingobium sp.]|nr:M23 family metallopeptidase [Sphingobium sp.]